MTISKLRVLLHAVRHNPLAALWQAGLFALMVGAVALIISATSFNVIHHTGVDHGSWVDLVGGIIFTLLFTLAAVSALFGIVESSRAYLRPFAEQEQGFIYPSEEFEERMQAAANRRLNLPEEQLALF